MVGVVSRICCVTVELHYFSREFDRDNQWYRSHFPQTKEVGKVVGERSNSYLDTPYLARSVYTALPHAKLVAQLNPVDRAYSDYCMLYRRGEVGGNIENYLDPRTASENRFLVGGHSADNSRDISFITPRPDPSSLF